MVSKSNTDGMLVRTLSLEGVDIGWCASEDMISLEGEWTSGSVSVSMLGLEEGCIVRFHIGWTRERNIVR